MCFPKRTIQNKVLMQVIYTPWKTSSKMSASVISKGKHSHINPQSPTTVHARHTSYYKPPKTKTIDCLLSFFPWYDILELNFWTKRTLLKCRLSDVKVSQLIRKGVTESGHKTWRCPPTTRELLTQPGTSCSGTNLCPPESESHQVPCPIMALWSRSAPEAGSPGTANLCLRFSESSSFPTGKREPATRWHRSVPNHTLREASLSPCCHGHSTPSQLSAAETLIRSAFRLRGTHSQTCISTRSIGPKGIFCVNGGEKKQQISCQDSWKPHQHKKLVQSSPFKK